MTETVCVTLEQLREIEVQVDDEGRLNWCPACEEFGVRRHESHCWLAEAIAQAERLKDWKPKIAQPVRIVAMPSVGPLFIATLVHGAPDGEMADLFIKRESGTFLFGRRYLAELMPKEGEC